MRLRCYQGIITKKGNVFVIFRQLLLQEFDYTPRIEVSIEGSLQLVERTHSNTVTQKRQFKTLLLAVIVLLTGACAALQPPGASGPVPSGPPYPATITGESQRTETALLELNRILRRGGAGTLGEDYLQPVTATIRRLPGDSGSTLYLPKVGSNAEMNEEETREALRRFINDWRVLIGSNPSQLSLIERIDNPDRTKVASYEQRVFRYPLRGDFGKLQITFTGDRRLLNLTSTCIPDAERLQATLAGLTPQLSAEDAIKTISEKGTAYTDTLGNKQAFKLEVGTELGAPQLVTYVQRARSGNDSLEVHIAWEVTVTNAPVKAVYIDAINGESI